MSISGWWPNPSGIGALSATNFSNLLTDGVASNSAGGKVYLMDGDPNDDNFPFDIAGASFSVDIDFLTWFKASDLSKENFPNISKINKDFYLSSLDLEKNAKLQSWGCLLNSIDSITDQSDAVSYITDTFSDLLSSSTSLSQNEGIFINIKNGKQYITGLLADYEYSIPGTLFDIEDNERVSSNQLRQAYQDAIDDANQYLRSIAEKTGGKAEWFKDFTIPDNLFAVIAHAPEQIGADFLGKMKNELWAPADICSTKSGFTYENTISWSESVAVGAAGIFYLNPLVENIDNFKTNFFHLGISQGDIDTKESTDANLLSSISTIITQEIDSINSIAQSSGSDESNLEDATDLLIQKLLDGQYISQETGSIRYEVQRRLVRVISEFAKVNVESRDWPQESRQWAFPESPGGFISGFAGTLFNGVKNKLEIPQVDSIGIVPTFSVFPEVYQCLVQKGPAWEYISSNNLLTDKKKSRLHLRKYVFIYQFATLAINRLFIQGDGVEDDIRSALPVGGLPASAIRYIGMIQTKISGNDFRGTNAVFPDGNFSGGLPTMHFRLYNPLYPGEGFAHSTALRLLFIGQDIGTFMGAMMGASSGTILGVAAGEAIGASLQMYSVTFAGIQPSYRTLYSNLIWNPYNASGNLPSTTAIMATEPGQTYQLEADVSDDGEDLPDNRIISILDSDPLNWDNDTIEETPMNGIATWALWPSSWPNKDEDAYFTRGLINLQFKARIGYENDGEIFDADLSKYFGFLEFRFYAVDMNKLDNDSITNFLDSLSKPSNEISITRKNSSHIDDVLGKWEFILPVHNNAGPDHFGPGREFVWKYFADNKLDSKTEEIGFENVRNQNNRIFSSMLDNNYKQYNMNLFLNDFRIDEDAKNDRIIFDDSNKNFGNKYLNADNLFFFVNIRSFLIDNKSNSIQDVSKIKIYFNTEGSNITTTGKLLESSRLEYSQYFNDNFVSEFQNNENITPVLRSYVPDSLKLKIKENFNNYDSFLSGNILPSNFVNLTNSSIEDDLEFFYIRCAVSANLSDNPVELVKILSGLDSATSHFLTPYGLMNLIFLAGNPDQFWRLSFEISDILFENGDKIQGDPIFLINIDYLDYSGKKIFVLNNAIVKTMPETEGEYRKYTLDIGPILSDMTILGGGWLILSLTAIVGYNQSGAGRIKFKNNIQLDHNRTIGKIKVSGRAPGIISGQSISWYRGLNVYGRGVSLGTDAAFVSDAGTNTFLSMGGIGSTFRSAVISPAFAVNMDTKFGWVIDARYTGFTNSVRVALRRSTSTAEQKKSLAGATGEFDGISVLNIDDLTGKVIARNINTRFVSGGDEVQVLVNGQEIFATEVAIAQSSSLAYDAQGVSSIGSLATVTDHSDNLDHPKTWFLFRPNNQDFTYAKNSSEPDLYDIDNISLVYNAITNNYHIIGRHISGCYLIGNVNHDGLLLMPLRFVEGRLPELSEQIQDIDKNKGSIQDDILIDNYPFNIISNGYFDVRSGATQNNIVNASAMSVIGEVANAKTYAGAYASFAKISEINSSTLSNISGSRNGVEVSAGKPAIITDGQGSIYMFYSYSSNFKGNNVDTAGMSPFAGRIYCVYSGNAGITWTPPICVFNISLFNTKSELYKYTFSDMIVQIDSDNNSFNGVSDYPDFDGYIGGYKSFASVDSGSIREVAMEDFDAIHDLATNEYYISFWFGGFICYSPIGPIMGKIDSYWQIVSSSANRTFNSFKHTSESPDYAPIYQEKDKSGNYIYTKNFWDPGYRTSIYVASGPIQRILSASQVNHPKIDNNDNMATSILKSYGVYGSKNIITNPDIFEYKNEIYNQFYSDYWKGTFPPSVFVKFGNKDFDVEQIKQKPLFKYMSENIPNIIFYNSNSTISYIPLDTQGTSVATSHPQILGNI